MTLEQVVLTMINDKMLDNGQISEKLHSSIQKDIITLSTFNTVVVTRIPSIVDIPAATIPAMKMEARKGFMPLCRIIGII